MKIKQFFNADEIRRMAYDPKLYVLAEANQKGFMSKTQVCKLPPEEINKLLEDNKAMFVVFEKESAE